MIVPNADAILALSVDDLKILRSEVTLSQPEDETPPEAYFAWLVLMSAVEEMRGWSRLAEPGLGPKVAALGWTEEISDARTIDRRNLEFHREAVERFDSLGGKVALQQAIDRLNLL